LPALRFVLYIVTSARQGQGVALAVSPAIEYASALIMSLRPGPVPEGRRMFDVPAEDTTQPAEANDLQHTPPLDAKCVQQTNHLIGVSRLS
jgi:hypothetical protein